MSEQFSKTISRPTCTHCMLFSFHCFVHTRHHRSVADIIRITLNDFSNRNNRNRFRKAIISSLLNPFLGLYWRRATSVAWHRHCKHISTIYGVLYRTDNSVKVDSTIYTFFNSFPLSHAAPNLFPGELFGEAKHKTCSEAWGFVAVAAYCYCTVMWYWFACLINCPLSLPNLLQSVRESSGLVSMGYAQSWITDECEMCFEDFKGTPTSI